MPTSSSGAEPRVSITLTTRDRPGFAFVCLSSLLCQTFREWDLVIIDSSETPLTNYVEFAPHGEPGA